MQSLPVMSLAARPFPSACCARCLRASGRRSSLRPAALPIAQRHRTQRRWDSSNAPAAPAISPKIESLVEQIGKLTLLETADLVSTLKTRLNIPDMPIGGFAPGPSAPGAAAAAAPAEEPDEPAPAAQEKTLFALTLKSFDAGAKPKIIKEVKGLLGLSLVDSKKFVEAAPKLLKDGVPKEEGAKIVEAMKALGGVVVME